MPDDVSTPASLGTYTIAERKSRIRIYIWTAALTSLVGGIVHLSALTDDQLAHQSIVRWVLTILVLVLSPVLEGLNALRAAIDRSTSGPHPEEGNAGVAATAPAAPVPDTGAGPVEPTPATPHPQ